MNPQLQLAGHSWNRDIILEVLKGYRCQFSIDDEGDGLDLVDILSPFTTIKEGNMELELLADHIEDALTNLDRFRE
jgi:hypothetical protein